LLIFYGETLPEEPGFLQGTQNKKEYAYIQSYGRTSVVLPDMGQTEEERGESHE
jgi:hypothetical protein